MKTKLSTFLFVVLSSFILAQPSIPWKRNFDITGVVQGITKQGDTFYAYTSSGIYTSSDFGSHWTFCSKMHQNEKNSIMTSSDSVIIIDQQISSHTNTNCGLGAYYKQNVVVAYDGCQRQIIGNSGGLNVVSQHSNYKTSCDFNTKFLNDGSQLSFYQTGNSGWSSYGNSPLSHNLKLRFINNDTTTEILLSRYAYDQSPLNYKHENIKLARNIIGHSDDYFISVSYDYNTPPTFYLLSDQNLDILSEKSTSINHAQSPIFYEGKIYILTHDGVLFVSNDLGQTWSSTTISSSFPTGSSTYNIKNGLHIIQTDYGDFWLSTNGVDFNPFLPPILNGPKPRDFYVFDGIILVTTEQAGIMYRSFDNAVTWEAFFPKGLAADNIDYVFHLNQNLLVSSNGSVYRKTCTDQFLLDTTYSELSLNRFSKVININNQTLIRFNFQDLQKFNQNTKHWETIKSYPYSYNEIISAQGDHLAIRVKNNPNINILDTNGVLLNAFNLNESQLNMKEVTYSDSTIFVYGTIEYCEQIYGRNLVVSHDNGLTWDTLTVPEISVLYHDGLFYSFDGTHLYGFSDIGADTTVNISVFSEGATPKLTVTNNHILLQSGNQSAIWDGNTLIHKIENAPGHNFSYDYQDSTIICYSNTNGLWTSKSAYFDSTVVETLPQIVSSDCNLESGNYIKPGGPCQADTIVQVSNNQQDTVHLTSTLCYADGFAVTSVMNGLFCFTESGDFQYQLQGKNGACDTILQIHILPGPNSIPEATVFSACFEPNDTITYDGYKFTFPGTYQVGAISSVLGCDSIRLVAKIEQIQPIHDTEIRLINCPEEQVLYDGKLYVGPTTYFLDTIFSQVGCDSLYHKLKIKLDPNSISCNANGIVFYDHNQNGIKDNNDETLPNIPISISTGDTIYSNDEGYYYWYSTDTSSLVQATITDTTWNITTDTLQEFYPLPAVQQNHDFGLFPVSPDFLLETNKTTLKIQPNPANDIINISVENATILDIQIFDSKGALVTHTKNSTIDISSLPKSIYLIKIMTNQKIITGKFITQ